MTKMADSSMIKLEESHLSDRTCSMGNDNETERCNSSTLSTEYEGTVLLYGLRQKPTAILSAVLALQVIMVIIVNVIWLPLVIAPSLCIHPDDQARAEIISQSTFSSGISTIIFSTIGLRLPVLQLPDINYIRSILNALKQSEMKCPGAGDLYAMGHENRTMEWKNRLKMIQGGIIITSVIQFIFGITGISGLFDRILSNPLVLIPTTIAIGFSWAYETMNLITSLDTLRERNITVQWGILILTVSIVIITGLKFHNLDFTVPKYTHEKGFSTTSLKLFRMFPVLVASIFVLLIHPIVVHLLHGINKKEKLLLKNSFENLDANYFVPVPFPYGWPPFQGDIIALLVPAAVIQIMQSILIYRVTNFIYGQSTKRRNINKGITIEGICSLVAAVFGISTAGTPINIGLIQLTGVGSRWIIQLSGIMLIIISIFASSIKILVGVTPIFILSVLFVISALITVTGLMMLRQINTSSVRNCTVVGLALYATSVVPNAVSNISSDSITVKILVEILSSNIIICVLFSLAVDSLLPKNFLERTDLEEEEEEEVGDESVIRKENEHKGLSLCEEIFSICL